MLDGVSITFAPGSTVLLGPNGAGKSTLLGLAASLLRPSAGQVHLGDLNPGKASQLTSYRQAVGWMPQRILPVPGLTVREQVAYAGWLKKLSRKEAWKLSIGALETVGLADLARRRSHELSGGQLRRLGLAQAIVHDARVVLMDEPTAGLDPDQCDRFRSLVGQLARRLSVIVSTHDIGEISSTFHRVAVLDGGMVRFHGPVEEFVGSAGTGQAIDAYRRLVSREV